MPLSLQFNLGMLLSDTNNTEITGFCTAFIFPKISRGNTLYFFCFEQDYFSIGYLVEMLDISTFWQFMLSAYVVFITSALLLAVPTIAFFKSIKVTKRLVSGEKLNFKDKVLLFPWAFAVLYFGAVILLWLLCSGIVLIFNEIAHLLK